MKAYVKGPIVGTYKSPVGKTDIKNVQMNTDLTQPCVYPNPTCGIIHFDAKIGGKGEYRLYDFNGKIVTSGSILSSKTSIDFLNVQNGMYMLRVFYNQHYYTYKLIIKK